MAWKKIPRSELSEEEYQRRRAITRASELRYNAKHPNRHKKYPHKSRAAMSEEERERAREKDRAYHIANREKRRQNSLLYYAGHREEQCQKSIENYHANKPRIVAQRRAKASAEDADTKAAKRAYNVAYRAANHARLLANERDYAKSPRGQEARKQGHHNRRARKLSAPRNDFTAKEWRVLCKAAGYRCAYCDKKFPFRQLTPDHITPLARGGSHTLSNILPACLACNMRKHAGAVLKPVQPFLLLSDEEAAD